MYFTIEPSPKVFVTIAIIDLTNTTGIIHEINLTLIMVLSFTNTLFIYKSHSLPFIIITWIEKILLPTLSKLTLRPLIVEPWQKETMNIDGIFFCTILILLALFHILFLRNFLLKLSEYSVCKTRIEFFKISHVYRLL